MAINYRPREGIVYTNICGQHVLIPTRSVYQYCKLLIPLPMIWAATWTLLKEGNEEKVIKLHKILTKKSDHDIIEHINDFCKQMCEAGYMERV